MSCLKLLHHAVKYYILKNILLGNEVLETLQYLNSVLNTFAFNRVLAFELLVLLIKCRIQKQYLGVYVPCQLPYIMCFMLI